MGVWGYRVVGLGRDKGGWEGGMGGTRGDTLHTILLINTHTQSHTRQQHTWERVRVYTYRVHTSNT